MDNSQGREIRQDFLAARGTQNNESTCVRDVSETWMESDIKNRREVKSHMAKCRLIEIC